MSSENLKNKVKRFIHDDFFLHKWCRVATPIYESLFFYRNLINHIKLMLEWVGLV